MPGRFGLRSIGWNPGSKPTRARSTAPAEGALPIVESIAAELGLRAATALLEILGKYGPAAYEVALKLYRKGNPLDAEWDSLFDLVLKEEKKKP